MRRKTSSLPLNTGTDRVDARQGTAPLSFIQPRSNTAQSGPLNSEMSYKRNEIKSKVCTLGSDSSQVVQTDNQSYENDDRLLAGRTKPPQSKRKKSNQICFSLRFPLSKIKQRLIKTTNQCQESGFLLQVHLL